METVLPKACLQIIRINHVQLNYHLKVDVLEESYLLTQPILVSKFNDRNIDEAFQIRNHSGKMQTYMDSQNLLLNHHFKSNRMNQWRWIQFKILFIDIHRRTCIRNPGSLNNYEILLPCTLKKKENMVIVISAFISSQRHWGEKQNLDFQLKVVICHCQNTPKIVCWISKILKTKKAYKARAKMRKFHMRYRILKFPYLINKGKTSMILGRKQRKSLSIVEDTIDWC